MLLTPNPCWGILWPVCWGSFAFGKAYPNTSPSVLAFAARSSVEQIKTFLQSQIDINSAIENIENINSTNKRITYKDKTILYIPNTIKTKGELKGIVVNYMQDKGQELSGYEEVMKLEELLDSLEWKIE